MKFRDHLTLMLRASAVPASELSETLKMTAPIEIEARMLDEQNADKPITASIALYSGGLMKLPGWPVPVVADLTGMSTPGQVPMLGDHQNSISGVVGHGVPTNDGRSLTVEGTIFRSSAAAQPVIAMAREGFRWQASMGAEVHAAKRVRAGTSVNVNGQTIVAPDGGMILVTKSRLREATITPVGADPNTSAAIAAKHSMEASAMKLTDWLKAKGITADQFKALPDSVRNHLAASFQAEHEDGELDIKVTATAKTQTTPPSISASSVTTDDDADDPIASLRASGAAELKRQADITAMCGQARVDIAAKAISEGWTIDKVEAAVTKAELEEIRASRTSDAKTFNINTGAMPKGVTMDKMIEASMCLFGNLSTVEKDFHEDTLQAASEQFRHGIGLQQLILEAAWANGYSGRHFNLGREMLKAAFAADIKAGGFSTISLTNILGAVANKFILEGFNYVENSWREISAIGSVRNFQTQNRYRLTGDFEYEELGPTGEIKHDTVGEDSFTISADTYAKMFAITRKDLINDDMGALTVIPRRIGRGAALKLNKVFWTAFMNNSDFFKSDNSNYFSGASTNLQSSSLKTALQKFRDQTDPSGQPLGVQPAVLLVPTALEVTQAELLRSTRVVSGNTTKEPDTNIWAGRFKPVVSAYLSNSTITGNSSTAWYLLADPMDLPVIETVFLNGMQSPTVETADADFNQLGIQMRGYHDFGVSLQDYRGGVKSKGAA